MRIAIVHEWFVSMRGGEKVVEQLCEMYPEADVFALLWDRGSISPAIERHRIATSFLQRFPLVRRYYRHLLPLYPLAVEGFDLNGYDLVISSSHCAAKGVIPAPHAKHLCYCYTPMRYIWNMYFDYFGKSRNPLASLIYRSVAHRLRIWDVTSNDRVDEFVAISGHVANRIGRYYHRRSTVIYPPVDTEFYHAVPERPLAEEYYLVVSALVPYKRVDLAVEACNRSGKRLVVIGEGPEKKRLERLAGGTVTFLGWESDERLRQWFSHCSALLFPGEEDFGIVPVEAQACGSPVIALARGGALETVIDRATGVLFSDQTVEGMQAAIAAHESLSYDRAAIVANAQRFSRQAFRDRLSAKIDQLMATPGAGSGEDQ